MEEAEPPVKTHYFSGKETDVFKVTMTKGKTMTMEEGAKVACWVQLPI